MTGDSPTIHDADGRTVGENAKFWCFGFEGDPDCHGVILDLIDPDVDSPPRVKVRFDDGQVDYLPTHRRDPDSDIYVCDEIVVEKHD
jgi:hypothetical protein